MIGRRTNEEKHENHYFASTNVNVGDLPLGAKICQIPGWIAKRLAEVGLNEPIPFSRLKGKYWTCGMGGGVVSTEDLSRGVSIGFQKHHITDGPYDNHSDAEYAFDEIWESPE